MMPKLTGIICVLICLWTVDGEYPAAAEPASAGNALYKDPELDMFMKRWLICGPFQASSADEQSENQEAGKLAFAFDFLKQHGGEAKIQPGVGLTHERDGREYQWRLFRSEGNFVNLSEIYGAKEWHLVAYAWAEIQMSARTTVLMGIGSNDALKIRLNGEIIHENWGTRRVTQDYYVVPVELRQGKNQLLIKVQYTSPGHWGFGHWGFMCRPVSAESAGRALIPAANDGRKSTVEALLSADLNINIRNVHGQTPLHRAAYGGHRSIAELLIEKGADVNARSIDNLTPFHLARRAGYMDMAELLVEKGADVSIQPNDRSKQVDTLFASVTEDAPGASVIVIQDGMILHKKGYGMANLEHGVPNTPQKKFRLGSITKQFTAMAIMQLQEKGLLNVDDPVAKYLPDYPNGERIRIHHLLTHTSGIPDFKSFPDYNKTMMIPSPVEKTIERFRDKPLDFEPGEKLRYSNSAFILLGHIIEILSGRSYEEYLKESIFQPLNMDDTGYDHSYTILRDRASGYVRYEEGRLFNAAYIHMSIPHAAGALYSTVEDLYLWDQALYTEKLVKRATLQRIFTPVKLNNGDDVYYGFGWFIDPYRGLREIWHSGSINGFEACITRFPDQRFSVVVLSNSPHLGPRDITLQIAEIYLSDRMDAQESHTEAED